MTRLSSFSAPARCDLATLLVAPAVLVACLFLAPVARAWPNDPNVNVSLCVADSDQVSPTMVSDGAGGAIVTWQDKRGGDYDVYAQRVSAAGVPQWTPNGVLLCAAANDQSSPSITSDGAGGAIIAWEDYRGGTFADIYAQRVSPAGVPQWTVDGVPLCTFTGDQNAPMIASDGMGGAIVTWNDFRSGNRVYARRVSATGLPQWTADGVALCTFSSLQIDPRITSDGAGGAIVAWRDGRGGGDIYAQRVDGAGALQWSANGDSLCTAAGLQRSQAIVSDGAGGAIIAWNDGRSGAATDIYARRVNAAGTPQWAATGVAISAAAGSQFRPVIESDGAGGAIITWTDQRSGNWDVYVQRVSAAGAPQWTSDGVALCTAANNQGNNGIVADGAGGAIITWTDPRGADDDVFAQRVNSAGAPQWAANGVAVSTAGNDQYPATYPSPIIADGAGGAIITWNDFRNGSTSDIYAQRVDHNGDLADATDVPPGAIAGLFLAPPSPTPTSAGATLRFGLPREGPVTIVLFDLDGREVRGLEHRVEAAGDHSLRWDGRDEMGRAVPSGLYFLRLDYAGQTRSARLIVTN